MYLMSECPAVLCMPTAVSYNPVLLCMSTVFLIIRRRCACALHLLIIVIVLDEDRNPFQLQE
jgi:hypothetical protein